MSRIVDCANKYAFPYLVFLFVIFLLCKVALIFILFRPDGSIFELQYGFGPYIQNLFESGRFFSCFRGVCQESSRMPLLPLFYAALTHFSKDQVVIALIKSFIMSIYSGVFVILLIRMQARIYRLAPLFWSIALTWLFMSYPVIKHAYELTYEEALLSEVLLVWSVAFSVVTLSLLERDLPRGLDLALSLCLLNAAFAFFIKASMVLVLGLTIALWVVCAFRAGIPSSLRKASSLVVLLTVLCMGAWWNHNAQNGRATIMTSYDAESLYRGNSALGYMIYPDVNLDQILDSPEVVTRDGRHFEAPAQPRIWDFPNEWAWSDYFRAEAMRWVAENPGKTAHFFLIKAANFFLSIEKSPFSFNADAHAATDNSPKEVLLLSVGLLQGRIATLILLVCAGWLVVRGGWPDRAFFGLWVLACGAYAAPYIVGFNYSRHITVFFVIVIGALVSVTLRLHRLGAEAKGNRASGDAIPAAR